jgi:hypothetical protein
VIVCDMDEFLCVDQRQLAEDPDRARERSERW